MKVLLVLLSVLPLNEHLINSDFSGFIGPNDLFKDFRDLSRVELKVHAEHYKINSWKGNPLNPIKSISYPKRENKAVN